MKDSTVTIARGTGVTSGMSEFEDSSINSRKCGYTDTDSKDLTETSLTREVWQGLLCWLLIQQVAVATQRLQEKTV